MSGPAVVYSDADDGVLQTVRGKSTYIERQLVCTREKKKFFASMSLGI